MYIFLLRYCLLCDCHDNPVYMYNSCSCDWLVTLHVFFSRSVATIGGHVIYKIKDTVMYPVSNSNSKPSHPDEARYASLITITSLQLYH